MNNIQLLQSPPPRFPQQLDRAGPSCTYRLGPPTKSRRIVYSSNEEEAPPPVWPLPPISPATTTTRSKSLNRIANAKQCAGRTRSMTLKRALTVRQAPIMTTPTQIPLLEAFKLDDNDFELFSLSH